MIIISNRPGQLGNLLMVYAHFLAYGLENKMRIVNPAFYSYTAYFKSTKVFSLTRTYPFYTVCYFLARTFVRLRVRTKCIAALELDWNEKADMEKTAELKSRLCFVQGWQFRSQHLLLKHQETIRDFFQPESNLQEKLNQFFHENFTDASETIIGIHVRRGDYKNFENGKYFYSMEEYANVIQQLARAFAGQKLHFLICANEPLQLPVTLTNTHKTTLAPGHELLDMYSLARCQYIAGPPSTYSIWASFYGEVPLCMIYDPKAIIAQEDFKIYTLE